MRRNLTALALWILLAAAITGKPATGQVILYDNLGGQPFSGPRPDAGDRYIGQQFLTGDFGNVSSVTVSLQRVGTSSGPLHVQIWDDDGAGRPGSVVGTVGSVDLASLSASPAFTTVDGLITGLSPHTPYYVVLDTIDANILNLDNTFRVGTRGSSMGTGGADKVLATNGPDNVPWVVLSDFLVIPDPPPPTPPGFDPDSFTSGPTLGVNFMQMQVSSIPEPSSVVLGLVGLVAAIGLVNERVRKHSLAS